MTVVTGDLFGGFAPPPGVEQLAAGTWLLRGYALEVDAALLEALGDIEAAAPFRHMVTRGGFRMSVAMTNCGALGWVSDRRGYRYAPVDPDTGRPWPAMPAVFVGLARRAAATAGFAGFDPDACLVNRYGPGAAMSLHQDRNERDFDAPIVSVSLGVPARFLLGGAERADRALAVPLAHGDVLVWGGPDRLRFHGVGRVPPAHHPSLGACRINLTFRKAG